jgi:hypothetical protein
VDSTYASGGRFLKKADANDKKELGIPTEIEAWCIMDGEAVLEKAKQALRQKAGTDHSHKTTEKQAIEKKFRASKPNADSVRTKRRRSQVVSPFQDIARPQNPGPLDWSVAATPKNQEVLTAHYSRHSRDSPKDGVSLRNDSFAASSRELNVEVTHSVSMTSEDSNEWQDSGEELFGQRFYPL